MKQDRLEMIDVCLERHMSQLAQGSVWELQCKASVGDATIIENIVNK